MVGSGKQSPVYENERSKNSKYTVHEHNSWHMKYLVLIVYVDGLSTFNTSFGSVITMEDRKLYV